MDANKKNQLAQLLDEIKGRRNCQPHVWTPKMRKDVKRPSRGHQAQIHQKNWGAAVNPWRNALSNVLLNILLSSYPIKLGQAKAIADALLVAYQSQEVDARHEAELQALVPVLVSIVETHWESPQLLNEQIVESAGRHLVTDAGKELCEHLEQCLLPPAGAVAEDAHETPEQERRDLSAFHPDLNSCTFEEATTYLIDVLGYEKQDVIAEWKAARVVKEGPSACPTLANCQRK